MEQDGHSYRLTGAGRRELNRMRKCSEEVRLYHTFGIVSLLGQKPYAAPDLLGQLREMGWYTPPLGMQELEADLMRLRSCGWIEAK